MRNRMVVAAVTVALALPLLPAGAGAQEGHASWYALRSKTASGEMMNPSAMTAAHRSLPFGTRVRVENLNNGRSVVVRINDRGPFVGGRVIDVSRAAASELGFVGAGTTRVRVTAVGGSGGGDFSFSGRGTRQSGGGGVVWIDGRPSFGG